MRLAVQLTPTTPIPLFPTAPMVPAVCVPCPASSIGLHIAAVLLAANAIALKPWLPAGQVALCPPRVTVNAEGADHMFAARSGCV